MKVTEVFKTIFARFGNIKAGKFVDDETGEDLNDVAKVLSQFNIQLYDAQGNMADVGKILDKLANQWKNLEIVEKNALASAIAGTRQRENFIVLMDNYKDAIKYTEEAMNSSGIAMEKYDAHLQSIEGSQAKLKATFEDFSQALVDKGIIKGFYDLAIAGVNFLTLIVKLKPLLTIIGALIFSKLVVGGFGKLKELQIGKFFINIIDKLDLMRLGLIDDATAIKTNVHSFKDLVNGLKNGTISIKNFKAATDAAMSSTSKWQLLITLVTLTISTIISSNKKYQQQLEENAAKAKEVREETENQIESIKDLEEEYEKLQNKTVLDETDQERIIEIEKELNEQIELINQKIEEGNNKELEKLETLNLQNGEYTKQKNILSQLDETTSKILANEAKSEKIAKQKEIKNKIKGQNIITLDYFDITQPKNSEFKNLKKILEKAFDISPDATFSSDASDTETTIEFSSNADKMIEQLSALREARDYYLQTYSDEELVNNSIYNSIVSAINKYGDLIDAYETATLKYWQSDVNKDIIEDLKSSDYIEGDTYKIVDSTEAMEAYIAQLQEEAKTKNGGVKISEAYAQAIRDAVENAFPQFIEGLEEETDALLDLQYTLEEVKEAYETLDSAIEEYNSNGSISYDTWKDLIELEDRYLSLLIDENGQIKSNTKALQDLMKVKIEDATLTKMEQYVNNLLVAAQQGNLNAILLSTEGLDANTDARLRNIMAVIASNPELMKHSKVILQNLNAMAQLTSSISLGSDSTKDAKDATEDWEKVLEYANTILDEQIEKLEKEQEALEKLTEEKIKAHEAEIKRLEKEKEVLEEKNEEKNKELELEELENNLKKAKQRTMRVYRADLDTWVWEQDPEALKKAQQELDDFHTEQQIENIEDLIEAEEDKIEELEENLDKEIKSYEERIKAIKDYKEEWKNVKLEHEKAQNEIEAKARLGADVEKKILMGVDGNGGRLGVLNDFKIGYTKALREVASKTEELVGNVNTSLGKFNFEEFLEQFELINSMVPSGYTTEAKKYGRRGYRGFNIETGSSGLKFIKIGENEYVLQSHTKSLASSDEGFEIVAGAPIYSKPYASGTLSARAGLATVDEKGEELIIPKQGRYRMMEYGDTVVPHNLSQRLFEVASNPLRFIANALNSVKIPNLLSNSNQISNTSTINIGTIELPSVTNADNFVKQLQLIAANR